MPERLLILASSSPRRRELLAEYGIPFSVEPPVVEEHTAPEEAPDGYVLRCARAKAEAVAERFPRGLVLGADTAVVFGDEVLGKPGSPVRTRRMLEKLSGKTHLVMTAVVFLRLVPPFRRESVTTSSVTFRKLRPGEIEEYARGGEGLDKAGGYAIQGAGGRLISEFTGSFTNIVGLPMEEVTRMLAEAGFPGGEKDSGTRKRS